MSALPLLTHPRPEATFCWTPDGPVSAARYLAEAQALARQLPPARYLLNLCQDRYRFALGFAAGLQRGMVSLQPSSQSVETLRQLQQDYPEILCLCDHPTETAGLPRLDFPALEGDIQENGFSVPNIPAGQTVAILFTSGSTGRPQPQRKVWGKLLESAGAEARQLGLDARPHAIVGTVPVQHSYGFESTFLLALQAQCPFWSGKPFYPQDIAEALAAVPEPRLLVTTPFHLKALLDAEIAVPPLQLALSATAPLAADLAALAEARLAAPLREIYGATETGQLASRRTADGPVWSLLPGITLAQEGEDTLAFGPYIEGRIALADLIEILPESRFLLHGRRADLVNIAGKRTSLSYLNHQITAIPGVVDAAFFLPDDAPGQAITRLAAFVVAPDLAPAALLAALRQRIDSLFLPRPLVYLDRLPREATGKLPRARLEALYHQETAHGKQP